MFDVGAKFDVHLWGILKFLHFAITITLFVEHFPLLFCGVIRNRYRFEELGGHPHIKPHRR